MEWKVTLAQWLDPMVYKEVKELQGFVETLQTELLAMQGQLSDVSEQLQKELDKKPTPLVKDDPQPTWMVGEDIVLEKPTQKNKPSSNSYLPKSTAINNGKTLAALTGGHITLIANTNSMEPHIDANSVVVLQPVDPSDVGIGDIITYDGDGSKYPWFHGKRIIHRVINVRPGQFLLKGDNNFKDDGWIDASYILGRYVGQVNFRKTDLND